MAWIKKHLVLVIVAALVAAWCLYRWSKGLSATGEGHASPEDAIAEGWMVYQAGITGWQEVSPLGHVVEHMTGWTGDPFTKA
jgi:hypothetical protein